MRESGIYIDTLKKLLAGAKGKKVALIDACRIKSPWKAAVVVYKPKLTDQAFIFSTKKVKLSNMDKDKEIIRLYEGVLQEGKFGRAWSFLTNLGKEGFSGCKTDPRRVGF